MVIAFPVYLAPYSLPSPRDRCQTPRRVMQGCAHGRGRDASDSMLIVENSDGSEGERRPLWCMRPLTSTQVDQIVSARMFLRAKVPEVSLGVCRPETPPKDCNLIRPGKLSLSQENFSTHESRSQVSKVLFHSRFFSFSTDELFLWFWSRSFKWTV